MDTIKIILADDELLFRKGILFMLEREKNIEIVFEASNGDELVKYLNKNQDNLPDIILMDLKMPLLNGVEETKKIHKKFPNIKIIALTSYDTKPFIINMIQEGACSYLVKNASPKEMIFTINEVASKGFYYNDLIMNIIHEGLIFGNKKTKSSLDEEYLTTREKEILELICEQLSTIEIAEKLFISVITVETHRRNLLQKFKARNMIELVKIATENKLI